MSNPEKSAPGVEVLETFRGPSGKTYAKCRCYCGKPFEAHLSKLKAGHITSCGCSRVGRNSLVGKVFGQLSVKQEIPGAHNKKRKYSCLCTCGSEIIVISTRLIHGVTKSCGSWECRAKLGPVTQPAPKVVKTKDQIVAELLNRGYRYISGEWSGIRSHFQVECLKGHPRDLSWPYRKTPCPRCFYRGEILTGQKFNKLEVMDIAPGDIRKWICRCDCGATLLATTQRLKSNHTRSCGSRTCVLALSDPKYQKVERDAPSKLTIEEMDQELTKHGLAYVSGNYVNCQSYLEVRCPQDHLSSVRWEYRASGCRYCRGMNSSSGELALCRELEKHNLEIWRNQKILAPYEVDIYLPAKKVAIEFNGVYWHSEAHSERDYHFTKFNLAQEKGVVLLQFWEDEWESKPEVVLSIIKAKLGIFEETIQGRKTTIEKIEAPVANAFHKEHHLQGATTGITNSWSLRKLGTQEVVAVVSIGPHHRGAGTMVLKRLTFKKGVRVLGGFSKLIQVLPRPIITWSDNRYATGEAYHKAGFHKLQELKPDYCYVKNGKRIPKQSLKKTHEERISGRTESELRSNQGYLRLFDAGKVKWELA